MAATVAILDSMGFPLPDENQHQGANVHYKTLKKFLGSRHKAMAKGPIALIFVEDFVEVDTTIRHHLLAGFKLVVVFGPPEMQLPTELTDQIVRVDYDLTANGATEEIVNSVISAANGAWIYYCYNAEYLFHPFCESRSISEMLAFHEQERRDAVLGYVVDLYARDIANHPTAVSLDDACLDRSGYYALARPTTKQDKTPKNRQLSFFGGLRWRFEEHIPEMRRRIDRVPLFKAKPGLKLLTGHTFNDEEYNTYSCPWHHNMTVAIASFRTAKALKTNAGSTFEIDTFQWRNSVKFQWNSQQLLDLGLMEPGQWF